MKPDLERMVKEWLIEEERFVRELPPSDITGFAVSFAYEFATRDFHHAVVQPKDQDKLVLQTEVPLSEEHKGLLFKQMSPMNRGSFLWDLRLGLLWKETSFQMLPSADKVEKFVFTRILFEDGLNKMKFEEAISELHRAILFVSWNFQKQEQIHLVKSGISE